MINFSMALCESFSHVNWLLRDFIIWLIENRSKVCEMRAVNFVLFKIISIKHYSITDTDGANKIIN